MQMILPIEAMVEVTIHIHSTSVAAEVAVVFPARFAILDSRRRREIKAQLGKERMHHGCTRRLAFFVEAEGARRALACMVRPKTFFFAPEAAIDSFVILLLKLMTRHASVNQAIIILALQELVRRLISRFKNPSKMYILLD